MRVIQPLSALSFGVLALLVNQRPGLAHGKGLYATEAEALQRAAEIGCNSVHENNGRWMPCIDERELHQQLRKQ
ncbi:gibberellin regulated protein [bacterium]|nr:gibberellin regulated protein [bacterium]